MYQLYPNSISHIGAFVASLLSDLVTLCSPFRRRIVPLRILFSFLALTSLAWAGSFDQPVAKKTVDLGPSKSSPGSRAKVTCYFFSSFMVKEVDMGEKGADRLAVVPITRSKTHTCTRLRDPGERVVNPDDWTGYFKGVKGGLVFFDADDGVNGGIGFAVYDSKTMNKVFDDVAVGDLKFSDAPGPQVTIAYTRVVDGGCIVPKDPSACWQAIQKKLGLENATVPDCKAGYEKSAQDLAKGRCQAQNTDNPQCLANELPLARKQSGDANSIIVYPVETLIGPTATIRPVAGSNLRCWPSD
jgi:hypothetical protein